jgi:hypothetical protein
MTSPSTRTVTTVNPELHHPTDAGQDARWPCIARVVRVVLVALILGLSIFAPAFPGPETWI